MSSIALVIPYFKENRPKIIAGLFCLIVVDLLQLIIPRFIKRAVDDLTTQGAAAESLALYAWVIIGLAVLIGVFRYVWRLCLLGTSRRVEEGLRDRLFAHLQGLCAAYFDRTRTGDLMAHATNDIQQIRMATGMGLVALNDAVVMGAAAIGFMVYINLTLTLLVLIPMPLIVLGTRFFSRKMHHRYQAVQEAFADLTESVRERMAGIRLIKAHNRKTAEAARVAAASQAYVAQNLRLVKITGVFFPMMVLFTNLSLAIVLFFGGRQTILMTITPGDFAAFISYLGLLTWPMMALGWVTNLIQRGRASLERVRTILATPPEIGNAPGALKPAGVKGEVRFEEVRFTYRAGGAAEGSAALDGVDLTIAPGSVLGIVGPPGSGKTTLINLIPRLYDPTSGRILLDGKETRHLDLEWLRSSIAFTPQEPFLFAGTIRDNISFSDPAVDDQRLAEAAEAAALHDTVAAFPHGYDTVVGEKGVMLSGGQKQRVALARCLLANAPLVILDDPISQVDFETGARITQTLRRLAQDRTMIIVSHRLSALRFADRIIVLDRGRVAESGRHADLLASGGYYSRTYRLQELEEGVHAL